MHRRFFLRLFALGVVGHELDIDRLLWVPGQKTIFIPDSIGLTESQIIQIELERLKPRILTLFDRDDTFYILLTKRPSELMTSREVGIPLEFKPKGEFKYEPN